MQNVVLTVHLILAALLIGVVLLQRSEGGGLGIGGGGGGGGGGVMTGRQAANALSRATWVLATLFLITSLVLTVLAAHNAGIGSVLDRIDASSGQQSTPLPTSSGLPQLPDYTPPPGTDQPALPPVGANAPAAPEADAAAAPATPQPAETAPADEAPAAE